MKKKNVSRPSALEKGAKLVGSPLANYMVIDGEGLLHQSFHKFSTLKSSNGTSTGAIYGFFRSLRMYLFRFKPNQLHIVFDNGHSKYRDEVLPTYKSHRKKVKYDVDYESLYYQKKQIIKFLRLLKIPYIYDRSKACNYEGDDFIAYLTFKALEEAKKTVIVTSDKDFNQLLLDDRVKIYNPRKDMLIYQSNCKVNFGYEAHETVDYLTLVGDSSDDIPGYPGIGPTKAAKFLEKYGSIEKYLQGDECLKGDECHLKMRAVYNTNRLLIDLKYFLDKYPIEESELPVKTYRCRDISEKLVTKFANKHEIGSFKDPFFLKVFVQLNENKLSI